MRRAWMILRAFGLSIAMAATASATISDDEEIRLSDCPGAVQKTFREEARGATIDAVNKETEDGETSYWVDVVIGGKAYVIGVDEDGRLIDKSLDVGDDEVSFFECPAAVQKALREESKGANISQVTKEIQYGVMTYGAVVPLGGRQYEIRVAEDGTLTGKTLVIEEEEVELVDCPPAVRERLREEAAGAEIGEITRASGLGKRVYLAEVRIKGRGYSVEVAEDGTLISKAPAEGE
jgi:hypothetical protein